MRVFPEQEVNTLSCDASLCRTDIFICIRYNYKATLLLCVYSTRTLALVIIMHVYLFGDLGFYIFIKVQQH